MLYFFSLKANVREKNGTVHNLYILPSFHKEIMNILCCSSMAMMILCLPLSVLQLAFVKVNPAIHFGLCTGTRSSPIVRFFTPQGVEAELRNAPREFFQKNGMEVDLAKRTVYLTRIIKW